MLPLHVPRQIGRADLLAALGALDWWILAGVAVRGCQYPTTVFTPNLAAYFLVASSEEYGIPAFLTHAGGECPFVMEA